MRFGDTLSDDQFAGFTFDYCISNPPFGIDWKREQKISKLYGLKYLTLTIDSALISIHSAVFKRTISLEIPMTRYFYEYKAPEKVEDIVARIHVLEADISASLEKLFAEEK